MCVPSIRTTMSSEDVTYINTQGQVTTVKAALDSLSNSKEQILFSTYSEFPAIGEAEKLYVDISTGILYLYNTTKHDYDTVVSDIDEYVLQSYI